MTADGRSEKRLPYEILHPEQADAVRAGKSVRAAMLGEGQLPLDEIMQLLREHGYSGPLVVDVRDLPDGIAGARHAADILRKLFHRA